MTVSIKTRVLSEVPKVSQKTGNVYRVINFMDGDYVANAMCKAECTAPIVPFEEHIITLDISIKYGSFKIINIERCK